MCHLTDNAINIMGMSNEISPQYMAVNPTGQVAYILDSANVNLAQIQLASIPASDVFLIQEEGKPLSESPILVAEVGAENLNLLGNNVIVIVSQPQEMVFVNSEVAVEANICDWQANSSAETTTLLPFSLTNVVTLDTEELSQSGEVEEEIETSSTTVEDARLWLQDSLITTAALTSLSSYVQSRSTSKDI